MTLKRFVQAAFGGLLVAGAVGVTLATPASAGPVQITADCQFQLVQVQADDLQENAGDEIYLLIGDRYTKTVNFDFDGDIGVANEFGTLDQTTESIPAGGRIRVEVWEYDGVLPDDLIGAFYVYCTPGPGTKDLHPSGADYDVSYRVVEVA